MATLRRMAVGAVAAGAVVLAVAGSGWAQSTTSTTLTTSTTSSSTSTTTSTAVDRCLGDLIQIDLGDGAVECRRPDGSLACLMPAAFFGTCPPRIPEGPFTTLPPDQTTVVISTSPHLVEPAPTRAAVRFTG